MARTGVCGKARHRRRSLARRGFFEKTTAVSGGGAGSLTAAPFQVLPTDDSKTDDANYPADFASPPTDKVRPFGNFKTRTTFAAAAALICVVIVVGAANFRIGFFQKDDSPRKIVFFKKDQSSNETPAAIPPTNGRGENEKPRTSDSIADELYLAGKEQMEPRTPEGLNKAIEFFSEAVKRDPNFALAFSGLADVHSLIASGQPQVSPENSQKAEEYAVKALALDSDLAQARVSLGMARFRNADDFGQAEKHFLRAIEINPSLARARHWYSVILSESGKFDDALREIKIAAELEPRSAVIQLSVGELYMLAKNYDEADFYFDKAIENDKEFVAAYHWKSILQQFRGDYAGALETYQKARIYKGNDEKEPLWLLMRAHVHAANGRGGEALAIVKRFFQGGEYSKESKIFAVEVALVYNLIGDAKNAFVWLGRIKIKNPADAKLAAEDPRFSNLHADSRFVELAEKWLDDDNAKSRKS